ncbi:hypothetical protein PAXINDRAFT_11661 [Paxillus involutus ATCC 200175]|uniref:Peptidase S53 activation domain-containing protein n=1 Tax=Paxillus involutus ATCC 200175 TaxID=664439 RepID=A0A0C9TYY4_PAXIN|nr:hypothetical protein PAXINDRAFT_11661 [Paxillus involutus ATCC 200175]
MRSLLSLVILSLGLLAAAEPALSPYTLHEKRTHVPAGWSLKRRHDASTVVPLRFALTQKNIDEVGKYLMEVSHPKSENYGKHWTAGEVIKTFAPSEESIEAMAPLTGDEQEVP